VRRERLADGVGKGFRVERVTSQVSQAAS
jgi:hypothetical protein